MTSLDLLYLALALGFLIFVGFFSYVLYNLAQDLKIFGQILTEIRDLARDIDNLKNSLKLGAGYLLRRIFNFLMKGGEGDGIHGK